MAGIAQTNPWSYSPYSTLGPSGFGSIGPSFASPQSPVTQQLQYLPQQIQQLQQLLQIVPYQIQQLQQAIQFLPQHVAQLVVQTLSQPQGNIAGLSPFGAVSPFGLTTSPFQPQNVGGPFQSMQPGAGSPFPVGQSGYVM
jgi:hypothetical protein